MAQQPMYPAIVNSPQTELAAAIDNIQATISLTDASKLPNAPNLATIGSDETAETILYTGKSGNDLTGVTRGFQGIAKAWGIGSKIARLYTAYDHEATQGNIADLDLNSIKRNGSVAMAADFDMGGKKIWNPANLPCLNIMPDSGRFMGVEQDPHILASSAPFTNSSFFSPYNSTVSASAGKFINNNNDFGGTSGAMSQDVVDLCNTLLSIGGRTILRYGAEFHVGQYTMGSGTSAGFSGKYLLTTNEDRAAVGSSGYYTFSFWVRIKSGGSIIILRTGRLYKNGVEVPGNIILTPSEGWVHVQSMLLASNGYMTAAPSMYANSGDVVQIALPVVFPGGVGPGIHTSPIARASLGYTALNRAGDTMSGKLKSILASDSLHFELERTVSSAGKVYLGTASGAFVIYDSTVSKSLSLDPFKGLFVIGGVYVQVGSGSPEGVVAAPVSSLFLRTDGGAGTLLYVKQSGTGNTGWAKVNTTYP